ncbi:MAG: hypothetical protein AMXMBFR66_31900 [Pseudomonadota bacterium]
MPAPVYPQLRLLGAPALQHPTAAMRPLALQDASLLAVLALRGPMPRVEAVALLWPDSPPSLARTNLRQRLYRLRRDAGCEVIAGSEWLELVLAHDLAPLPALTAALVEDPDFASAALLGAASGSPGLRPGARLPAGVPSPWEVCLADAHAAWCERLRLAVLAAASECESAGRHEAALALLRRAAGAEPMNEDLQRRLMQWLYSQGARAEALEVYEQLRHRLRRELGLAPAPDTAALADLIRREAVPLPASALRAPQPPGPDGMPPATATASAATAHRDLVAGVLAASLRRPPRLVQRVQAWEHLERTWRERRVALVCGEAGIGKSRLLLDFAREHPGIVTASARPGDAVVPYTLLARLTAAAWVQVGHAKAQEASPQPDWVRAELARLVPALGTAAPGPLSELRLMQAMARLLRDLPGVCLDDLHFADTASVELLPALLAQPLPWLLALRPQEAQGALAAWLRSEDALQRATITLHALDATGLDELLDTLALPGITGQAWTAALLQHTGGRPLFVLEVLRALLRQGAPVAVPERLPLPGQMQQLLLRQLERLAERPRLALQAAAVLGHRLPADTREKVLAAVLETSAMGLAVTLGGLEDAGLLVGGEFAHDMLLETVASALPEAVARLLHRRIAEQLHARADDLATQGAAAGLAARLAVHWAAAGCPAEAAAAHEQAAAEAWMASRRPEEVEHRTAAAGLWDAAGMPERAFEARLALSQVMVLTGRLDDARGLTAGLHAAAATPRQHAAAGVASCNIACTAGAWQEAVTAGEDAFEHAVALDQADLVAACAPPLAVALSQTGRGQDGLDVLDRAGDFARRLGEPRRSLDLLSYRGHVLDRLGRIDEAAEVTQQALALAESLPDWTEAFTLAGNLAILRARQARLEQAAAEAARGCDIAARLGITQGLHLASTRLSASVFAAMLGRLDEGVGGLEAAIELYRQADASAFVPAAENHLAWLWMVLGQPARARRILWHMPADLPPVTRARRLALRGRLARFCGLNPGPAAEWQSGIDDEALEPTVRIANALELVMTLPPSQAAARAAVLEEQSQAMGLASGVLQARIRRVQALVAEDGTAAGGADRAGRRAEALQLARALRGPLRECQPNDFWRPEAALVLASAFDAGGECDAATELLRQADAWLRQAVLPHVPAPFVDGFWQRNLVNAAIARAVALRD